MEQAFQDVIDFEVACGNKITDSSPCVPDEETRELRLKLLGEEFKETYAAIYAATARYTRQEDVAEIADGLADLIWVAIGTAIRFGIDLPTVWEEVRKSNMAKFGPGSWKRIDGKIMKPLGWKAPEILNIVRKQKSLREICASKEEKS